MIEKSCIFYLGSVKTKSHIQMQELFTIRRSALVTEQCAGPPQADADLSRDARKVRARQRTHIQLPSSSRQLRVLVITVGLHSAGMNSDFTI